MSPIGTCETYGLDEIVSASRMKPEIGPQFAEVRV
jgi:hypothetical protein